MDLLFFLLAGVAFLGGLIWIIIAAAANKPVKPGVAVLLSSFLLAFLGMATCTAGVVSIFT